MRIKRPHKNCATVRLQRLVNLPPINWPYRFEGKTEMPPTTMLDSDSLLEHGVLMIGVGALVCASGSMMAAPVYEQLGYILAATFLGAGLLVSFLTMGFREMRALPRPVAAAYIAIGMLMVCYGIYSAMQGGSPQIPLVGLLAGLIGLNWVSRCIALASTFKAFSSQAIGRYALAAANSSLGVILATRIGTTRLGAVMMAGCYVILVGVQVYLAAVVLYREVMRENAVERK